MRIAVVLLSIAVAVLGAALVWELTKGPTKDATARRQIVALEKTVTAQDASIVAMRKKTKAKTIGDRWVSGLCAGMRPAKAKIDKYLNDPQYEPDPGSEISRYLITICDFAKVP